MSERGMYLRLNHAGQCHCRIGIVLTGARQYFFRCRVVFQAHPGWRILTEGEESVVSFLRAEGETD